MKYIKKYISTLALKYINKQRNKWTDHTTRQKNERRLRNKCLRKQ